MTTHFEDSFSEEVWASTYKDHKDESVDSTLRRVAKAVASVENTKDLRDEWEDTFYKMLSNFNVTVGGRIYSNAGTEWGGTTLMNCFTPDAEVLTITGPKQICDVEIGDLVLTHKGRYQKVVNTMTREYHGQVQRFHSSYFTKDIVSTPEHPYYQGNQRWVNSEDVAEVVLPFTTNTDDEIILDLADILRDKVSQTLIEVHESKINTRKDYIGGNGAKGTKKGHSVQRFITVDSNFAYLLGRFVGDGCTFRNNKNSLFEVDAFNVAFNASTEANHAQTLCNYFEQSFGITPNFINSQNNTLYLRKASQIVAETLRRLVGEGGATKRIPSIIWESNKDIQVSFLKGLYDADGFVTKSGDLQIEMTNDSLIAEIQTLTTLVGIPSSRSNNRLFAGSSFSIDFRSGLCKHYEDSRLEFVPSKKPSTGPRPIAGEGFAVTPERFDETYSGFVYNISVDEDESYVVNNVVVHNCFVGPRPTQDLDSLDGILTNLRNQAQTLKSEGGWGENFSYMRPRGTFIHGIGVETPGAVKYMELFDKSSEIITSGSGKKSTHKKAKGKIRKGAMMGVLDVWHPDIVEFITAKQQAGRLSKFNVSVNCTDEFMSKVIEMLRLQREGIYKPEELEEADKWNLRFPDTTFEKYNDEWYGDLKAWEEKGYPVIVHETISVMGLWDLIMKSTYNRAEPGVLFLDRANYYNPGNYFETIMATNPCGEQTLSPGNICCLGSINLTQFVNKAGTGFNLTKLATYTKWLVRFLDNVNSLSNAPLPEYEESMRTKRRIGCGILGWGSALYMLKTRYGSDEAEALRDQVMKTIAKNAYMASIDLAEEKGKFTLCNPVKHSEGAFVQKLGLSREYMEKMRTHGCRNASLLSLQPTGNTSIFANIASGGCEPVFMPEYIRTVIVNTMPDHIKDVCPKWYEGEFEETKMFKFHKEGDETILRGTDDSGTVYKIDKNRGLTKEVLCEDYGVRNMKAKGEWDETADWAATTTNLSVDDHIRELKGFAKYVDSAISKCVAKGTLIATNKGIKKIEDLGEHVREGFTTPNDTYTVLDENGEPKPVTNHYYGGNKPCKTIRFDNGFELTAALTHKLKTVDGWISCDNLQIGDKIFYRTNELAVNSNYVELPQPNFFNNIPRKFPKVLDENFALFLGMWMADGCTNQNSVVINEKNSNVEKVVKSLFIELFGDVKSLTDDRWGVRAHMINSPALASYFKQYFGTNAADKTIPQMLLDSPKNVWLAFLNGLTLGGYVKSDQYRTDLVLYDGYSKDIAQKVSYMLSTMGIEYHLTERNVPNGVLSNTTYGVKAYLTDTDTIVPIEEHKQQYSTTGKTQNQTFVTDKEFLELLDQQPRNTYGSVIRARLKKCMVRGNFVRMSFLDKLNFEYDRNLTAVEIVDISDPFNEEVYDIEVENTHSYLINGIVSHNTINLPFEFKFEDFKNLYLEAYNTGYIKGLTTYRSGTMTAVLSSKESSDSNGEEIILEDVKLPDSSPAVIKTLRAESRKWYLTVVYHEDNNRPFALFVKTNAAEKNVVADEAVELLMKLATKKKIPKRHRDDVWNKIGADSNSSKVTRVVSFLLRHGVLIKNIVAVLDRVESAYVGTFVFQMKKFLSTYIKDGEKVEDEKCQECGSNSVVFSEGCKKCTNCGSSKCG